MLGERIGIELGRYRDIDTARQALISKGCWVHQRAEDMFRLAVASGHLGRCRIMVDVLSVAEIGFPAGASYQQICNQAAIFDLHPCHPEVAHMLRLVYREKSSSEFLWVAMRPMLNKIGNPFVFALMKGFGGPLLYCDFAYPHTWLPTEHKMVFTKF